MARFQQSSFAVGEITPALHSRTDLQQYRQALAKASNFFVSVYGGLLNRAGTQFLDEVLDASRLIPFALGEAQSYVTEWGDNSLKFFVAGARMIVQPNQTQIIGSIGFGPGRWNDLSTGSAEVTAGAQVRKIPQTDGVVYGDLAGGGGQAAAFDGDVSQAAAFAANALRHFGHVGKFWDAVFRQLVGFRVYGSSDLGFTGRPQPVNVVLQGSYEEVGPYTTLSNTRVDDRPGVIFTRFEGVDSSAGYRFHRVAIVGGQSGPEGSGADIVAVGEVEFFDRDFTQNSISLVGAANSVAYARQTVTAPIPGVEHVLAFFVFGGPVDLQVGAGDDGSILPRQTCNPGWHLVSFTPGVSTFNVQFLHGGSDTRNVEGIGFQNFGGTVPVPLTLGQPYRADDMPRVTYTQDANILTLCSDRVAPLEMRRGVGPLSWSLTYKRLRPTIDPPIASDVTVQKLGPAPAVTVHSYQVTYLTEQGEESLPSVEFASVQGAATLSATDYMRITVLQPLPARVVACQLYKLFGGSYGLMGLFVAQFDDTGQAPKVDAPPPQARDPFSAPDDAPACAAYWEQRQAFGGSANQPETVELSKTGLPNNFGRSSPPRDDDAITFTPSGPKVRQIKHMLGGTDLVLFSEASVLIARRGESALTSALEGGVRQILARGISRVAPLQIDAAIAFVNSDGHSVRLLDAEYAETELSLLAEHLFNGREVIDWCYAEAPWSVLWMAMDDGSLVTLSLLLQQGVTGWAQGHTPGRVESLCAIREFGEDVVYWRVRRWLRGAWRNVIERHRSRKFDDIRDAYFVDCGLSLNNPAPIVGLELANPGVVTLSNARLEVGNLVEVDETGVGRLDDTALPPTPVIDDRRFRIIAVDGPAYTLGDQFSLLPVDWSGLGPWQGEGVVRQCFTSVSGLAHLEGSRVAILNDGSVEDSKVVVGGAITLESPGARIHVGLPILAEGELLDIADSTEGYARKKSVKEVMLRVRGTRALKIGPADGILAKAKPRYLEGFDEPNRPRTGLYVQTVQPKWGLGGKLVFIQDEPLPVELLSVTPAFDRGE